MALEAVNTAFALLQIEALLSDRGRGERERPKGWVKGVPNTSQAGDSTFFVLVIGQPHGEAVAHLKHLDDDRAAVDRRILDVNLRGVAEAIALINDTPFGLTASG